MDVSLSKRTVHFLSKAGPAALLRKCWLVALNRMAQPAKKRQLDSEHQLYLEKLRTLPVEDGHVTIPVMDFQMKLRADDQGLSKQLILHGIRERDAVEYLLPLLPRFRSVLEIGANQGYYAVMEALKTPPDARIYAFEPHPANVGTLKLNLELNNCAHKFVEVLQAAVSDRSGTANLQVHRLSNWHSLSRVELSGGWLEAIQVPTFSVDEYCEKQGLQSVDFVRMDVEGHEAEIIKGAGRTLRNSPHCVVFLEIHTGLLRGAGHQPEELLEQLASYGFTSIVTCGKGKRHTTRDWKKLIRNMEIIFEEYGNHMFFAKE